MRRVRAVGVVWVCMVAARALPLAAQTFPATSADEQVHVDAQQISYDDKSDTVVARGSVVIDRGDLEVRADEVRIRRASNEADAVGHVVVSGPEGVMFADAIHLNLDEETGALQAAQIEGRRSLYSIRGERIEKGLGQSYHIENGSFTTCRCAEGPPSWSVAGKDLRVALNGYGVLTGGTFNVLDVPIMYIPRGVFPILRDRQSGFLMPQFGFSNVRGFQTLVPFYWAIDKSQDATVGFDLETSARAGVIGEYRYTLSRDLRGTLEASYFNESFRGAPQTKPFELTVPEDRWSVGLDHVQALTGSTQLFADVFVVSDDLFLRDINTYAFEHSRDVAIRTLPFTDSRIGIVQAWDRLALSAAGVYYQDLTGTEVSTLQRAPEVDLWGQTLLGRHLIADLDASAVDFERGRDVDGVRLDVQPSLALPLPLGRDAFGDVHVGFRETAYHLIEEQQLSTMQELPQNATRELFTVGAEAGTVLDRVYPVQLMGLEKIKHTIEPTVSYLYIPGVSQGDLPLFDGVDRINARSLLTYGVVSRVIGKFAADAGWTPGRDESRAVSTPGSEVRELARFSLMQSVDLQRSLDTVPERTADHFSDVDFAGRVNPTQAFSLRFTTNYDTANNELTAARIGVYFEDPRHPPSSPAAQRIETRTSGGISYRFLSTENRVREIDDNFVLHLTDWAGLLYSSRYDAVQNRFLDNYFGLRLTSTCDCWALDVAVTDRTNPQEVEVRAQLTLVGLGSNRSGRRVAAQP